MDNILSPKISAPVKDDASWGVKRNTDPDSETLIKRTRLSESDDQTTSEEYCSARGVKRKASEHGEEEPTKEKKGGLDLNLFGKESASSEDSGIESCNTSVEDERVGKRKAADDDEGPQRKKKRRPDPEETRQSVYALRAEFEAKYKEQDELGEGGYGTVFGGYRKADNLPVAIKHIPKENIDREHDETGKQLSMEVAIMLKLADKTSRSVGTSAPVSLLDWHDLEQELILVLERPIPAEELLHYINGNGGSLEEQEAKVIVSVDHGNIVFTKVILLMDQETVVEAVKQLVDKAPGTHLFIPPKWLSLGRYRAGPTTVWQIGVVLFETLHRDAFFETTEFLENRVRISETLSKNCQDFLRRCLITDPKQRPTLEQLRTHPWLNNTDTHAHQHKLENELEC